MFKTKIIDSYLSNSNPKKRAFWRKAYNLYQLVNLNYIKSLWDLKEIDTSISWQESMGKVAQKK